MDIGIHRWPCFGIHLYDTVLGGIDVQIEPEVEEVLVVYCCQLPGYYVPVIGVAVRLGRSAWEGMPLWSA